MTTISASPGSRATGALFVGSLAIVAGVVAVAFLGGGGNTAVGGVLPSESPSAPIVSPSVDPTGTPSAAPTGTPTQAPTRAPSESPSDKPAEPTDAPAPEPSETPRDAMPITVDLDTLTPHDVYVDIVDYAGAVDRARSGVPTASASVAEGELAIKWLNDRTAELTWVDRPGDNGLALYIWRDGDSLRLVLVQPEHDLDGDAILHDRVLIVEFGEAVSPDMDADLVTHLDAPGG